MHILLLTVSYARLGVRLLAFAYAYVHMRESDGSGAVNQYGARIFESPQQFDQFRKKQTKGFYMFCLVTPIESADCKSSFCCIWKMSGVNSFQALIPESFNTWFTKTRLFKYIENFTSKN